LQEWSRVHLHTETKKELNMKEKIVLIGAGSAMFTRGLVADLIRRQWDLDLALVDVDPDALTVAENLTRKMLELGKSKIRLSAATDRRAVLKDASVVICTVGVGGRRAWEQDVFIPRKYGIYQPVGDTVMPGGTSRAIRMIPAMVGVAKDVLDLCPNALFFNYGNPMAAVCRGIRKATGADVVGLCHGVNHIGGYLAHTLDVPAEAFQYTAVGINHFTWFTEARIRGVDAMPKLREIARQRLQSRNLDQVGGRFAEAGSAPRGQTPPGEDNPFCWHLFDLFGAFPAVGDRHVSEFFPQFFADGTYYGKKLGVDAFSFEQTIAWGDRIYAEMREEALSNKPLASDFLSKLGGEHEQVTDIIESIRNCDGKIYSANLPNDGQVPNLPPETVIESPTIADGGRLKPLQQAPLNTAAAAALATRFGWVETVCEAALEGSRTKFIQALVLDGAVKSLEIATQLADELLAVHARHLPQIKA
jgi:alpha-galactosidase